MHTGLLLQFAVVPADVTACLSSANNGLLTSLGGDSVIGAHQHWTQSRHSSGFFLSKSQVLRIWTGNLAGVVLLGGYIRAKHVGCSGEDSGGRVALTLEPGRRATCAAGSSLRIPLGGSYHPAL